MSTADLMDTTTKAESKQGDAHAGNRPNKPVPPAEPSAEHKYRVATQDFLVDGLGGLIPGILFLLGIVVVLAPALQALCGAMAPTLDEVSLTGSLEALLKASQNTPNMIWIAGFGCALMLSYFLGLLFYRLDPKTPDRKSFAGLAKGGLSDQSMRERNEWLRQNYGCDNERDCEFPYPYLRSYLKQRGHDHLLYLVPWFDNTSRRSKTHLNRLKIRLKYFCPEKCWPIVRNEAQVRLATSMWYVADVLKKISVCGLAAVVVAICVAYFHVRTNPMSSEILWKFARWAFPLVLSPVLAFSVSKFCKTRVERFVHYQRLHEVFYILELAHTASKEHSEITEGQPLAEGESPTDTTQPSGERATKQPAAEKLFQP
jgi:hypothetical protein